MKAFWHRRKQETPAGARWVTPAPEAGELALARTISHLAFNCRDIARSVAFYRDILGCREKFTLTYGDLAEDMAKALPEGKKPDLRLRAMRRMRKKPWITYMSWGEDSFIELFSVPTAKRRRVPDTQRDLNYTHFCLLVSDIQQFRQQVIARGGESCLDTPIRMGMEHTWQMWLHDPDGNAIEIMEYTPRSYQLVGRPDGE